MYEWIFANQKRPANGRKIAVPHASARIAAIARRREGQRHRSKHHDESVAERRGRVKNELKREQAGRRARACGPPKSLQRQLSIQVEPRRRVDLPGFFGCELHPLSFTQELEHGAADGAAMEKVLDTALVADESEPLIDQELSDRPGWHTRVLRCRHPEEISEAHKPSAGEHYVLTDHVFAATPRAWPGSLRHAELENGVSVGRSLIEVKKSLELGLPPSGAGSSTPAHCPTLGTGSESSRVPPAAGAYPESVRFPGLSRGRITHASSVPQRWHRILSGGIPRHYNLGVIPG